MLRLALIATLLAASPPGDRDAISLCEESVLSGAPGPVSDEREAAAIVSRWMRFARLEIFDCATLGPARRLAFEARGGRVFLRLRSAGPVRERAIPWLDRPDMPLARTRAARALSKLAVLVDALLAEDRVDGGPEPDRSAEGRSSSGPLERGPLVAQEMPSSVPVREPPSGGRKRLTKEPTTAPVIPPEPSSAPAHGEAAEPAPSPPEPTATWAAEKELPEGEAVLQPGPALTPAPLPPAPRNWAWAVEASGSWRFRAPSVGAWEVGGGLHYGPMYFAATYQPEARWSLQGRPIGLWSVGLAAGARLALFEGHGFHGGALAGARIEWLRLRRRDLDAGRVLQYWDAGASAGLLGGYRFFSQPGVYGAPLGVELRVEAVYLPTGRIISVPDGPSGMLNRLGFRATACSSWDF